MRLIDAEALKKAISNYYLLQSDQIEGVKNLIDNAPTVETKFELKTENGITYPKALDNMTFSHSLSVEERQNIIQAYMLGANANERPHGKWYFHTVGWLCSNCNRMAHTVGYCGTETFMNEFFKFCPNCGADMREGGQP